MHCIFRVLQKFYKPISCVCTPAGKMLPGRFVLWFAIKNKAANRGENHKILVSVVFKKLLKNYLNGC